MKRNLALCLSLLSLLTACRTFDDVPWPWKDTYNDLLLSYEGETAVMPGSSIRSVKAVEDKSALHGWKVAIVLTKAGSVAFSHITEKCVGKQLTILASGKTILSAAIMAPIPDGKITVTGYKRDEARRIVDAMTKKPT